jgi:hypothetical protein
MEKLIELLNEYNKEIWKPKRMSEREVRTHYSWVICPWYWFIKWLVDNDKIDLLKLDNRIALSEFNKVERVLMALSIQDNPIEFLISALK